MPSIRSALASALPSSSPSSSPATSPRNSLDESNAADMSKSKKKDDPDKYRLLVTAGPSYDTSTHKIVHVNTSTPTTVSNEFLTAKIKVRIRGYRGLPSDSPSSSPYFEDSKHAKDQYSIAFSFVPKQDLPARDLVWGNDFDHPVRDRLPPGVNTAFKIVKDFVDPGLEMDAYADEPWLLGPALSCWFAFRVGDKIEGGSGSEDRAIPEREEADDVLHEGADGSGQAVREQLGLPENSEKRRKHFLNSKNREALTLEQGRLYAGDFYNPYLDFGNFALKLPGFSIKVIKYIDEKSHALRYIFKNRTTGDVYFCVTMNLLWGEQLEMALKEDDEILKVFAGGELADRKSKAEARDVVEHDPVANGTSNDEHEDTQSPEQPAEPPAQQSVEQPAERPAEQPAEQPTAAQAPVKSTEAAQEPLSTVQPIQIERSAQQMEAEDAGMIDKPDHVREQVQKMSIADMLRDTSSKNNVGVRVWEDDID